MTVFLQQSTHLTELQNRDWVQILLNSLSTKHKCFFFYLGKTCVRPQAETALTCMHSINNLWVKIQACFDIIFLTKKEKKSTLV